MKKTNLNTENNNNLKKEFSHGTMGYETLFENMLEGLAYCKMVFENDKPVDFVYMYVNSAFEKLTGLKDVVGKKVTEVLPNFKKTNPEVLEIYSRVSTTATPEKFEAHSDDFGGWLSVSAFSPEKDYFIAVFDNITERKKLELSQKESEEKYRALFDSAPLCIKLFDREGKLVSLNQHGREEHLSQGKTDEEIKNWKYLDCLEENYKDLVSNGLKEAVEGKSSEFDIEHVPGTTTGHWCHSNLVPVKDTEGEIQYVLFISRDITSEKNTSDEKNRNLAELEKFHTLTIDRELKMVELKQKITQLESQLKEKS